MNISNRAYGLETTPFEISVEVGNKKVSYGTVSVNGFDKKNQQKGCTQTLRTTSFFVENEQNMCERNDGWMEIKVGEFFTGEDDEEVKISLTETKGYHLKAGLVIEGLEVRPKH